MTGTPRSRRRTAGGARRAWRLLAGAAGIAGALAWLPAARAGDAPATTAVADATAGAAPVDAPVAAPAAADPDPAAPAADDVPAAAPPSDAAPAASAPPPAEAEPAAHRSTTLELGLTGSTLSNGFGSWEGLTGRAIYEPAPGNTTYLDVATTHEFGGSGTAFALGHVHELAATWIVSAFATTSSASTFLPRSKFDLSLGRKLLADQSLIATIGVSTDQFRDGHSDRAGLVGLSWYGIPTWVIEGGIRFNQSNPGGIGGQRYYAAATWGQEGRDFVAARFETGNEAYQVIGTGQALVSFDSQLLGLNWRHWLGGDRGFIAGTELYHNPSYRRVGVSIAGFLQL